MNRHIRDQLIKRDKRLYYDFLPEMEAIIEKPSNPLTTVILYTCFVLIITTIIWACTFRTDIIISANGDIDSQKPIISAVYTNSGSICEIYVNDGDYVEIGDVICRLDSSQYDIALEEYEYNLRLMNVQKELYEILYEKFKAGEISPLEIDAASYGDEQKIAEAIILENSLFINNLSGLTDDEVVDAVNERLYSITSNINKLDTQIEKTENEIKGLIDNLKNFTVTALTSGTVAYADKLYIGKLVNAGNIVCYINQPNNEYVFNAYVSDRDITHINIGDNVRLKLPAYDDTEYEYLNGVVSEISDIPLNVQGKGIVYSVEIYIENSPEDIKNGMEGNVDIVIGTRTVMDYFIEPFRNGLENSLEER